MDGAHLSRAVLAEQSSFDLAKRPEEFSASLARQIGGLDQHASSIIGVAYATDEAGAFEAIQRNAHASGCERHGVSELRGSQRSSAGEYVNAMQVGAVDPEVLRGAPIQRVDLAGQPPQCDPRLLYRRCFVGLSIGS